MADVNGNDAQGAAYVFVGSDGSWTQQAKLTASDGAAHDFLGISVALQGTTALVGAPKCDSAGDCNGGAGAVYPFIGSDGTWTQMQKLSASDGAAYDMFGWSVALASGGTTALIGALQFFADGPGAAYVFTRSNGTFNQTQKLTASDGVAQGEFGYSVALDGPTALVGANQYAIGGPGAAYVFDGWTGIWTQSTKLAASDGAAEDAFGQAVALSGTTALAGASGAAVNGNSQQGAAYFFAGPSSAALDLLTTAPGSVSLGDTYLVQAIATNEATATSPAVAVTVTVPAAASFVSASAFPGSCAESSSLVTCNFGRIGPGGVAYASVNLKATGPAGITIENSASIGYPPPKLSDTAPTVILATCPPGYATYSGTLRPNRRYRTPPYQSAGGKQTVTFAAPPDFVLHVGYRKDAQSQWVIRTFSRHAIYQYGPAGTYKWQINAGADGGGYTLCILHP